MINGDSNENGIKINRSNQQKKFGRAARFFVFLCRCFARLQCHFVPTMTSSNFLYIYTLFFGGVVVCTYQRFCFLCSCSLLFFHCRSFSPGRQHFSFFHRCYEIFMFFFQRNSSPLFSNTRSSSFSVIHLHLGVNIKINVEKDTTLLFFFSLSKSPGGHAIFFRCIWVALPVD